MAAQKKPMCKFGAKCYRKNKQHLQQFNHPKQIQDEDDDDAPPPKKAKKEDDPKQPTIKKFLASMYDKDDSEDEDESAKKEVDEPDEKKRNIESEDSASEDNDEPPSSPSDIKKNIKQKFLVEMPDDFFDFWDFCKSLNDLKPEDALLKPLGLQLVGPYDILAGKHKGKKNKRGKYPNFQLHWRYYYDPPEFMTVMKGDDETEFHLGYFRDDPEEMPAFVASNSAKEGCAIVQKGDNLFAAIRLCTEAELRNKQLKTEEKEAIKYLQNQIESWAKKKDYSLEVKSKQVKARDKKVVCKSFHGAGIVVPIDANEVGYREVPETAADLKKMFKKIAESKTEDEKNTNFEPLEELITLVQFANDECDYGEGLELGIDLFCYGASVFHSTISHILPLAYQLLRRTAYKKTIEDHLKHRRKGTELSEIE